MKINFKRITAVILCVLLIASVTAGCGNKVVGSGTTETTVQPKSTETTALSTVNNDATVSNQAKSTEKLIDISEVPAQNLDAADADYQTKAPEAGEEVATIHTNYGDISMRFFAEVAPMAVTNFKALAEAGRFDDTIFHRIATVSEAGCDIIQAGDYTNFNGTGGVSAFGESFGYEISDYTLNIRGSVAMAHSSMPDSNGSQFYINMSNNNRLDGDYTVFAQVYEGMDVADAIFNAPRSGSKPTDDVIITSVEIHKYNAE